VYQTQDLTGLEWASALVGTAMVALGYGRAAGVSPALLAGLMTRAMHEAARVGVAAGAEERTFFGLAGFGDLMAAMGQVERTEVAFGHALGAGKTIEQARAAVGLRVEAIDLVPRVVEFAHERGVSAPILEALDAIVAGRIDRDEVLRRLMGAPAAPGA
jgi:glycerol-3-phosphate dehydrogenase (NAD(P)+)